MRRLFWIGVGAAAGVYALRHLERATGDLPQTAARAVTDPARRFAAEVRAGMVEREAQIRDALGISAVPDEAPEGRHSPDDSDRSTD